MTTTRSETARPASAPPNPSAAEGPVFGSAPPHARVVRRPCAFGIIERDGRIAIVNAPNGRTLPGGGIEGDETPARAFERETVEECGFLVALGDWTARAVQILPSESGDRWLAKSSTFLEADLVSTDAQKSEPDHQVSWHTPEEARRVLSWPSHVWAVQQWLAQR